MQVSPWEHRQGCSYNLAKYKARWKGLLKGLKHIKDNFACRIMPVLCKNNDINPYFIDNDFVSTLIEV